MTKNDFNLMVDNPGILLVVTYFALLIINSIVIYLANLFFPNQVVLGTISMNTTWAIFHSMAALSLIATFAIPFFHEWENRRGKMLSSKEWMVYYFVLNAGGVWLITRVSDQFGLGITGWYVAVAIALVFDVFQGVVMMQLEKLRTK